ncbi:MAG: hypothetical protein E7557_01470 [Ruminococcaceae bacterium]|nr:hypothetical protein [Oscillospiraceae bacterium]
MNITKNINISLMTFILFFSVPLSALANSSWVWLTPFRPHYILPFVIIATLAIEILMIYYFSKSSKFNKIITFVILGNLLSFLTPYFLQFLITLTPYSVYDFPEILDRGPHFTVGIAYLILTLIIEFPVVYFTVKKDTKNQRGLIWGIIISNTITTIFTAIVEHALCKGHW